MTNNIFIGLGGTGTKILQCLKKKVKEDGLENLPWAFVCVDTDDILRDENNLICQSEFVHIDTSLAKQCIEHIDCYPQIHSWFGDKDSWIRLLEDYSGYGTKQCRRLGRLLFSLHENVFLNCIRRNVMTVQKKSQNLDVKFHIIASCCGGFGSGALIDVISLIRSQFPSEFTLEYPANSIDIFLKTPEVDINTQKDLGFYEANAFITIQELKTKARLFTACNLFSNSIETGKSIHDNEMFDKVAQTLTTFYTELEANWGFERYIQQYEISTLGFGFKLFGISTISYPVEKIKQLISLELLIQALKKTAFNHFSINYIDSPSGNTSEEDSFCHNIINTISSGTKLSNTEIQDSIVIPILNEFLTNNYSYQNCVSVLERLLNSLERKFDSLQSQKAYLTNDKLQLDEEVENSKIKPLKKFILRNRIARFEDYYNHFQRQSEPFITHYPAILNIVQDLLVFFRKTLYETIAHFHELESKYAQIEHELYQDGNYIFDGERIRLILRRIRCNKKLIDSVTQQAIDLLKGKNYNYVLYDYLHCLERAVDNCDMSYEPELADVLQETLFDQLNNLCHNEKYLVNLVERMKEESAIMLNLGSDWYTINKLHKNVLSFLIAPNPKQKSLNYSNFNKEKLSSVCNDLYSYNGKLYCWVADKGYSYNYNKMSIIKMGFANSYDYKDVLKKKYDTLTQDANNGEWNKFLLAI